MRRHSKATMLTVIAALLTGCFLCADAADDVTAIGSASVIELRVEGNQTIAAERILEVVKTRAGDTITPEGIDEDIKAIYSLAWFSAVSARTEPLTDGLRLIFTVTEHGLIASLEIVANKSIPTEDIEAAIELSTGAAADPFRIDRAKQRIEDLYHDRGHQFVTVQMERSDTADGLELRFIIVEGTHLLITKIMIRGNKSVGTWKIKSLMATKKKFLFLRKGVFDESVLGEDLLRIKEYYVGEGFLDARVAPELNYNKSRTKLRIIIQIDEGARYTVRNITFSGNAVLPTEELLPDLTLRAGGYAIDRVIQQNSDAILDAYGDLGYIEAQVEEKMTYLADAHEVDIQFDVVENDALYVGNVEIVGNDKTKDNVIRRDLSFYPGQLFSRREVRASLDRIRGRRFFNKVDLTLSPSAENPKARNVRLDVEEARTGHLSFGAGISSTSGAIGTISLLQRNFDITDFPHSWSEFLSGHAFTGAGQQFALRIHPGTELSELNIEFRDPHVADSDYSFGIRGFARERDRFDYHEQRVGGALTVGRYFTRNLNGEISVRVERIEISNLDSGVPIDVVAVKGDNDLIAMGFRLTKDTTNSYFLPTEGGRISGFYEYGGGDFSYHKLILTAEEYWTLLTNLDGNKHVLSARGELGLGWPNGETPIFERFYAGGTRSLRGFDYRGAGPHSSGVSVGGDLLVLFSVEYTVPLGSDSVRGALFCDTGGVWREVGDFRFSEFRAAAGAGLRIIIPALGSVPLSFDWAYVISSQKQDDEQAFSFNIGAFF